MGVIISIHALAKRATSQLMCIFAVILFQSTPSQRGRPADREYTITCFEFQSTPSQRGRLPFCILQVTKYPFQSTPSQRGRQGINAKGDIIKGISIHALAKRATLDTEECDFRIRISIHALAKRATQRY